MKFTRPLFCGYKSMSFVWHIQVVTMAGHSRFRASRRLTVNFTCHQIGAMRAHRAQQRQPCAHWHRMHCEKMTKQIRTEKKLRKKESIERSTTEISHSDGSNTERQRGRKKNTRGAHGHFDHFDGTFWSVVFVCFAVVFRCSFCSLQRACVQCAQRRPCHRHKGHHHRMRSLSLYYISLYCLLLWVVRINDTYPSSTNVACIRRGPEWEAEKKPHCCLFTRFYNYVIRPVEWKNEWWILLQHLG